MGATRSSREALGKMSDGLGRLVAAPGASAIELMTGGSPVDTIRQETRQGLTDILYGPFRIAKHTAIGLLKGAGSLLWKGISHLPIIPVWQKERENVTKNTTSKLAWLQGSVLPKANSGQVAPETA